MRVTLSASRVDRAVAVAGAGAAVLVSPVVTAAPGFTVVSAVEVPAAAVAAVGARVPKNDAASEGVLVSSPAGPLWLAESVPPSSSLTSKLRLRAGAGLALDVAAAAVATGVVLLVVLLLLSLREEALKARRPSRPPLNGDPLVARSRLSLKLAAAVADLPALLALVLLLVDMDVLLSCTWLARGGALLGTTTSTVSSSSMSVLVPTGRFKPVAAPRRTALGVGRGGVVGWGKDLALERPPP